MKLNSLPETAPLEDPCLPKTITASPAGVSSAEQPSTPDPAEAPLSASTRPMRDPADLSAGLEALSLSFGAELSASPALTTSVVVPQQAEMPSILAGSAKMTKASSRNRRRAYKRAALAAPEGSGDDGGEEDEDCTVCWSAAPCVIFQPCGHLCCCELCALPIVEAAALCPICRGPVAAGITI